MPISDVWKNAGIRANRVPNPGMLAAVLFVDGFSNGTGAEKVIPEGEFVGARIDFVADKPLRTGHLSERFAEYAVQAAVLAHTAICQIQDLFANFEFHRGHFKLIVNPLQ